MSQKRRHVLGDLTNEFSHICKVPATTLKNTVEKRQLLRSDPPDAKLTKIPDTLVCIATAVNSATPPLLMRFKAIYLLR